MNTLSVLYQLAEEGPTALPNCFQVQHPRGQPLLLAHLMPTFQKLGLDCSVFEASVNGHRMELDSLAAVVSTLDGVAHLFLSPASAPPFSPPEQAAACFEMSLKRIAVLRKRDPRVSAASSSYTSGSQTQRTESNYSRREEEPSPARQRGDSFPRPRRSSSSGGNQGEGNEGEVGGLQAVRNMVTKENVVAVAEAGLGAGLAAAKSIFSFASASIKTLTDTASAASAQTLKLNRNTVVLKKLLAEGGFGSVYLVSGAGASKEEFALKKLNCQSREQLEEANAELSHLQRFSNHENIIRLLDYSSQRSGSSSIIYLLFPLYDGTAWDLVETALASEDSPWPFSQARLLYILRGIAAGLEAMHAAGFAHRDMKPHNVLLDRDSNPIIMDLGSVAKARVNISNRRQASILQEEAAVKASAPYRCPELTEVPSEIQLDERIDVWSLGCTAYCMAFGSSPFENAREGVLRLAILNGRYKIPSPLRTRNCTFSDSFMDMINAMLQVDHTKRPFARDAVALSRAV